MNFNFEINPCVIEIISIQSIYPETVYIYTLDLNLSKEMKLALGPTIRNSSFGKVVL